MPNVIDLQSARRRQQANKTRISLSLRKLSRECRREILQSYGYHAYWLGALNNDQYIQVLQTHWALRKTLEELFESVGPTFHVVNLFNDEQKAFDVQRYVTQKRSKSELIRSDLEALTGKAEKPEILPPKAEEMLAYMRRVKDVYSVALLGILYMFEETLTYAGPRIARALDQSLKLDGKGTCYLRGAEHQKQDLWEFRKALDFITDYQTQANVVIASTMTYRMFRDLIDPRSLYIPRTGMFH